MKKSRYNSFIGLLAAGVLLAGCSKSFTERDPYNSIPVETALGTEAGLGNALNGVYAQLRSVSLYGRDLPVIGDLLADNAFIEVRNSGRYLAQYQYNYISSDAVFGEIWSAAYSGILRANQIISATPTGGSVPQIKAQAYGLRAWLYFRLVTLYAKPYTDDSTALGVPLILTYDPYRLPTRSPVRDVYRQIVSDLQTAYANAPDYTNSVTLSKYAIEGMLAKVYLYMGNYTAAKAAAVDVINNSGFTLVPANGYTAYWANAGIETGRVETLFSVDADVVNNNGFDDIGGIYINGYQDIYASQQLYSLYSATDVRRSVFVADSTKSGASAILVNKYSNAQNNDRDNVKVLRLSEVYLIAAESSVPGSETDARMYLNTLLTRRDPGFTGYTSTGATLLSDIVRERRKELAFEGDRFFDLNRLKLPINRSQNGGAITAGTNNANLIIPYPDYRRIAPIPQSELQTNPNITNQQNPGY
jgi:hypothetical protein